MFLRLVDLPDELLLLVTTSLCDRNAVAGVLRFAGISTGLRARLAAARRGAEERRLQWSQELSRHVRDPSAVQDIHRSACGRQAVALASCTSLFGSPLPAAGRFAWKVSIDRCIRNVIRLGIGINGTDMWGVYPLSGLLQHMAWDETGRLDFVGSASDGLPGSHGTRLSRALRPNVNEDIVAVTCVLDRGAGTLGFVLSVRMADAHEYDVGSLVAPLPALSGLPHTATLRPWAYLSNHGDAATLRDRFVRVV